MNHRLSIRLRLRGARLAATLAALALAAATMASACASNPCEEGTRHVCLEDGTTCACELEAASSHACTNIEFCKNDEPCQRCTGGWHESTAVETCWSWKVGDRTYCGVADWNPGDVVTYKDRGACAIAPTLSPRTSAKNPVSSAQCGYAGYYTHCYCRADVPSDICRAAESDNSRPDECNGFCLPNHWWCGEVDDGRQAASCPAGYTCAANIPGAPGGYACCPSGLDCKRLCD